MYFRVSYRIEPGNEIGIYQAFKSIVCHERGQEAWREFLDRDGFKWLAKPNIPYYDVRSWFTKTGYAKFV